MGWTGLCTGEKGAAASNINWRIYACVSVRRRAHWTYVRNLCLAMVNVIWCATRRSVFGYVFVSGQTDAKMIGV